jgi:hypothetical protein
VNASAGLTDDVQPLESVTVAFIDRDAAALNVHTTAEVVAPEHPLDGSPLHAYAE